MRTLPERLLRAASLAVLAVMVWQSLPRGSATAARERAERSAVASALVRWTLVPPDSAHVALDSVPPRAMRDWLVALRRAGTHVGWSGLSLPAMAIDVQPAGDPQGAVRARVVAPRDSAVVVRDRAGVLDTLRVDSAGAVVTLPLPAGPIRVVAGGQEAVATLQDSIAARRVLVIGAAGWESKFVVAALEESGWRVDARMHVAPGVDVTQGQPRALDTSRYAAVVVLDESPAPELRGLVAYVRDGGGLVLAATGTRRPEVTRLAPAALGPRRRPQTIAFVSEAPRRALAVYPLVRLRQGAIPLESEGGAITAAAMRVGAGRVTQLGYDESWRWRFIGRDDAPAAHRAWWSRVVASAAYRATVPLRRATVGESAPLAALHASLGPPAEQPAETTRAARATGLRWWMLAVLFLLLLVEWGSRRRRGAA